MSSEAVGWTFRHSPYSGVAFAVHIAIADSVNDQHDNELWMAVGTLASKARTTRKTAGEALARMVEDDMVTLLEERAGGTNRYRFEFPDAADVVFDTRAKTRRRPDGRKVRTVGAAPTIEVSTDDSGGCVPTTQGVSPHDSGGESSVLTNPRETQVEPKPEPKEMVPLALAAPSVLAIVPNDEVVFAAWIEATGRTGRTAFSAKRRRLVREALKVYPVDDVLDAVRGWQRDPFYCGDNKDRKVYNDIELVLRDAAHIEKFRDLERGNDPQPAARMSGSHAAILEHRRLREQHEREASNGHQS